LQAPKEPENRDFCGLLTVKIHNLNRLLDPRQAGLFPLLLKSGGSPPVSTVYTIVEVGFLSRSFSDKNWLFLSEKSKPALNRWFQYIQGSFFKI
jgi:hypothetical protein